MINKISIQIKKSILFILRKQSGLPFLLSNYLFRNTPIMLVDIGAHDGNFTKAVAKYCGISKAILIEPIPEKALQLRLLYKMPTYFIFENIISSEIGEIDFEINEASGTSSTLKIKRDSYELKEVKTKNIKTIKRKALTLDEIISTMGINNIDL